MDQWPMIQTFLTAVISGLAGWLIATLRDVTKQVRDADKREERTNKALTDGVRALLHNKLFEYYGEYRRAPSIPSHIWREIDRVYQAYHALGGNGTGTRLYESLSKVPLKPSDGWENEDTDQ